MIESNSHSPVATREEFASNFIAKGEELAADWRGEHPRAPVTLTGFVERMDATGAWAPLPLMCAMVGASGPTDQPFFDEVLREHDERLREILPVDGVFLALHGGGSATVEPDPEGAILERVRSIAGPGVPIVATLDLHANVSKRMVDNASVLVAYRTNPHVDMAERGAECADLLREMLGGTKATASFVKLPFIPPSVAQNTKSGPYADIIAYGQSKRDASVMNVSVVSGFSLGDSVKNGMCVIVTTRGDAKLAESIARDVATRTWEDRKRYIPRLTSIEDATQQALACGRDPSLPAPLFADVADNPGGGGRGNTVHILKSFHAAGVEGCVLGVFFDPALAAEAHALGTGKRFRARFNRDESHELSGKFEGDAEVLALHDGPLVGRRGISAGHTINLGKMALVRVGGIRVVLISIRQQAKDTAMFECLGIEWKDVRSLVLKSRGHFRAAFDLLFSDEQIVEIDAPGLTTPILTRVPYRNVPRPIYPLDPDMSWSA